MEAIAGRGVNEGIEVKAFGNERGRLISAELSNENHRHIRESLAGFAGTVAGWSGLPQHDVANGGNGTEVVKPFR
jgi:hypothetical protein